EERLPGTFDDKRFGPARTHRRERAVILRIGICRTTGFAGAPREKRMSKILAAVLLLGVLCAPAIATGATAGEGSEADRKFFSGDFDDAQRLYEAVPAASPEHQS